MNNEISTVNTVEKTMTPAQVAMQLKTSSKVILENARKCLPQKRIENGKTTYWNEKEVTTVLDFMKKHNNRTDLETFTTVVKASTS